MQVKKFEAPTIQEALDTIKRELGPEAIILQTKKNKSGFGLMSKASVEVTAAVSDRSLQKKKFAENRLPEPGKKAVNTMTAGRQAEFYDKYAEKYARAAQKPSRSAETRTDSAPIDRLLKGETADRVEVSRRAAPTPAQQPMGTGAQTQATGKVTATRYVDIDPDEVQSRPAVAVGRNSVEDELRYLKRMIEEMKSEQDTRGAVSGPAAQALETPALQDAFDQLVINGLDRRYALSIMKQAHFELGAERAQDPEAVLDQVAGEIMRETEVISPLASIQPQSGTEKGPCIVALVGPTGVGKTTTVAKMASEALLRRNLKVGLINLDSYKIAAFDQLGTYAKILNVPFRSVADAEGLKTAIRDFRSLDLVIIDTTGRSQRDPESLKEMEQILESVPEAVSHLVLSVTTRDAELYDMANRFSMFRPQGIIVSKLDEATTYGAIYNVSQRTKLPLLYFTTGQRVPEDIEEATRERVAALILDI